MYEYYINILDEDMLNIRYELSNLGDKVSIIGNGNFNESDNVILIKFLDKTYKIHALKSTHASYEVVEEYKTISENKKAVP